MRTFGLVAGTLIALGAMGMPAIAGNRALIIGIDEYQNLATRDQLSGAANDARLMQTLAQRIWGFRPDEIKMLINDGARASSMRQALLDWLPNQTSPGDNVLIYFSGHGYYAPDKNGDEADGRDEALVATDAKSVGDRLENLVLDDEIDAALSKLTGRKVMMIVDSCHSGTIERSLNLGGPDGASVERYPSWAMPTRGDGEKDLAPEKVSEAQFETLRKDAGLIDSRGDRIIWTAASATQAAQEDVTSEPRQGLFTRSFADGVDGAADVNGDGKVAFAELLQFTRNKAATYCKRQKCRTGMDPTFSGNKLVLAADIKSWAAPSAGVPLSPSEQLDAMPISASSFQVELGIEPASQVNVGQPIKLRIKTNLTGYLIVLDLRDDGTVYQLFPSQCAHAERLLRANATLTMPDPLYGCTFSADKHGAGKIVAIVTADKVPIDQLLKRGSSKGIEAVAEPSVYLAEIAAELLSVWTGDRKNRPVTWGLATADYRIE